MLLEADADINQVTSNGSCLHEAALYGKTDVVNMLLDVSKSVIAICLNMFPGHRGREQSCHKPYGSSCNLFGLNQVLSRK